MTEKLGQNSNVQKDPPPLEPPALNCNKKHAKNLKKKKSTRGTILLYIIDGPQSLFFKDTILIGQNLTLKFNLIFKKLFVA